MTALQISTVHALLPIAELFFYLFFKHMAALESSIKQRLDYCRHPCSILFLLIKQRSGNGFDVSVLPVYFLQPVIQTLSPGLLLRRHKAKHLACHNSIFVSGVVTVKVPQTFLETEEEVFGSSRRLKAFHFQGNIFKACKYILYIHTVCSAHFLRQRRAHKTLESRCPPRKQPVITASAAAS